ncbi:MAG: hypothetical protein RIR78_1117 [Actinomycetota bacterium]
MYRLKLGRIITLDPRVLTPNLDGFIPGGKTKFLTQSKWAQNGREEGALAGCTGLHAGFAQAAKALNQHRRGLEGVVAIDEVVEQLVVTRGGEVEEILDCSLFRTRGRSMSNLLFLGSRALTCRQS